MEQIRLWTIRCFRDDADVMPAPKREAGARRSAGPVRGSRLREAPGDEGVRLSGAGSPLRRTPVRDGGRRVPGCPRAVA